MHPRSQLTVAKDYWEATRPRIVAMVLLTLTVAALVAAEQIPPWPVLVHALVGSALVIVGAIVLNQRLEARSDAKMPQTAARPLPSGRLTGRQMSLFAAVTTVAGLAYLALLVNPTIVALAGVSWVIYVWVYTPLKLLTIWQTPVGAVAGAMPTLLGAAAAGTLVSTNAWALFGIVYFWQFPHAMAIAWLYRDQFAAAEVKVATVLDPSGRTAALAAVLGALVLVPVSLMPSLAAATGWAYSICTLALGLGYLLAAVRFLRRREASTARALLRVSLLYLPAVCALLLADCLS